MKAEYSVEERIAVVKHEMLFDYAFFSLIIMNSPFQRKDISELKHPTMATDGKLIYYCDEFIASHSRRQLLFAFCHEASHIAGGHHFRRGTRNADKWNAACDFSLNDILVRFNVGELKRDASGKPVWLYHKKFENMSPEEIYNRLPDPPPQGGGGGKGEIDPDLGDIYAPGRSVGEVMDACDTFNPAEVHKAEANNRVLMDQAKQVLNRRPGKLSADFVKLMNEMLEPLIDWRSTLQRFINQMSNDDYSWSRPNKRYLSLGFTLPSLYSEVVRHLVILADTSGSVWGDKDALLRVCSEINAAHGDGRIDKITFICVDTSIKSVQTFVKGDVFEPEIKGGGGTAFGSTMKLVAEDYPDATAAIFFTDMYVSDFGREPPFPVMWVIFGEKSQYKTLSQVPPYGECIPCYEG